MTKKSYMALDDMQELWTDSLKPYITETFAKKGEAGADYASVATCESIIDELT